MKKIIFGVVAAILIQGCATTKPSIEESELSLEESGLSTGNLVHKQTNTSSKMLMPFFL